MLGGSDGLEAQGVVRGSLRHLMPAADCAVSHFPLRGEGAPPPCEAGAIAEFRLASSTAERRVAADVGGEF